VLKWIIDRCQGRATAEETSLGWMPLIEQFDIEGLPGYDREKLAKVLAVNVDDWNKRS